MAKNVTKLKKITKRQTKELSMAKVSTKKKSLKHGILTNLI